MKTKKKLFFSENTQRRRNYESWRHRKVLEKAENKIHRT